MINYEEWNYGEHKLFQYKVLIQKPYEIIAPLINVSGELMVADSSQLSRHHTEILFSFPT